MKKDEVFERYVVPLIGEDYYSVAGVARKKLGGAKLGVEVEMPVVQLSDSAPRTILYETDVSLGAVGGGCANVFGVDGSGDQLEIRFPPRPAERFFSTEFVRSYMRAVRLVHFVVSARRCLVPCSSNMVVGGEYESVRFPPCGFHLHLSWALLRRLAVSPPADAVLLVEKAILATKRRLGDRNRRSGYGGLYDVRGKSHGIEVRGFEAVYYSERAVAILLWNILAGLMGQDGLVVELPELPGKYLSEYEPFRGDAEIHRAVRVLEKIKLHRLDARGSVAARMLGVSLEYLRKIRPIVYVVDGDLGVLLYDRRSLRVSVKRWYGDAKELASSLRSIPVSVPIYVVDDAGVDGFEQYAFRVGGVTYCFVGDPRFQ